MIQKRTSFSFGKRIAAASMSALVALAIVPMVPNGQANAVSAAEKQAEAASVRSQLVGLQADLETASDNYYKALGEVESARESMEEQQRLIQESTEKIESLQGRLSTRVKDMYKTGSISGIDFLLGASSFGEFVNNFEFLNIMNQNDTNLVLESKAAREQQRAAEQEYARQEEVAKQKADEAESIKAQTEAKVAQATEVMNSLDAEARTLLEQEQAAAAAAEAANRAPAAVVDNGGGSSSGGGGGYTPSGGGGGGGGGADVPSYGSVVGYAMSRIGCPYVWGAGGPDAFDCSGLVQWSYAQVGIYLPHNSEALYACATQRVPVSQAQPGDVLYRPGHVGIAVSYGGSHYVHAPTFGALVRDTDPLSWSGFTCALRFG